MPGRPLPRLPRLAPLWALLLCAPLFGAKAPAAPDTVVRTPSSEAWGLKQTAPRAAFERRLLDAFDSSGLGGRIGLVVHSARAGGYLHAVRPDTAFTPASTLKLVVTSTALATFPEDWAPQTLLRLYGHPEGRRFHGRLSIVGRGDPSVSGRFYGDPLFVLRSWCDSLRALGVDTLVGEIEVDRFWYPDPPSPETWERRFLDSWYGAQVTALAFNDNCALLRILPGAAPGDSVTVSVQPNLPLFEVDRSGAKTVAGKRRRIRYALDRLDDKVTVTGEIGADAMPMEAVIPVRQSQFWFEEAFREAMRLSGIEVVPESAPSPLPLHGELRMTTVPLRSIVAEINQRSQNFYAETLLRQIGAKEGGVPSVENGLRAERRFLAEAGIDTSRMTLLDGSGLSLGNRVTPREMNKLLQFMLRSPRLDAWWSSLAWPDAGTRMPRLEFGYRTRFKTGYVGGVQGLAGYVATALGDTLCVTLYVNGYKGPDQAARDLMDSLWKSIADHEDAERAGLRLARLDWEAGRGETGLERRIDFFSKRMLGRPYLLGPTGEGARGEISDRPLIRPDSLDCVTFVEHVLALALARDPEEVLPRLTELRYRGGKADFASRNHFFVEDWMRGGNRDLVRPRAFPDEVVEKRTMGRRKFAALNGLDTAGIEDPVSSLAYLPRERAVALFDTLRSDRFRVSGVAFVDDVDWLWATHVGLVVQDSGKTALLRHASSKAGGVAERKLSDYLKSRPKLKGVVLFDFAAPRAGPGRKGDREGPQSPNF